MTPEGRVKALIDRVLKEQHDTYYHKPVQNGMGAPTLDYVGCSAGRYFVVEAKAPGKLPTARQNDTMAKVVAAGGVAFVVDGEESLYELRLWLADPARL